MTDTIHEHQVLTFEQARQVVADHASRILPPGTESVNLLQSNGRVLAQPMIADRDMPPFARATRDGYAVRAADLNHVPAKLTVIGELKAGVAPEHITRSLRSGEAVSIMTGAPVPSGADAVVMVEHTSAHGGIVEVSRLISAGDNVVPKGAEGRHNSVLIDKGARLNEASIAVAASVGLSHLEVFVRPRVAVLATGDELVEVGSEVGPSQIRNSNSYSLAVQVENAGGTPIVLPIAPDEPGRLRELIEQGLQADLLVMSGGVSMGRYDLVEQVLFEMGAGFFFTGAKIQPGKPVVFGQCAASSSLAFREILCRLWLPSNFSLGPIIDGQSGASPRPLLFLHAKLKSTGSGQDRPYAVPSRSLDWRICSSLCRSRPLARVGDIAAQARANCYLVIPADRDEMSAGEWVPVMRK